MNDGPIANSLLDEAQIQRASTIPDVRFPERAFDLDHLEDAETHLSYAFKRGFDCLFSLTVIILGAPFFGLFALLVKLTWPGPVFFVQERLGKGGKPFQFYKFRTMHHMSDDSIHRSYSTNFINGMGNGGAESSNPNIFKLTQDSRVTPIGRFLRKTSLDERQSDCRWCPTWKPTWCHHRRWVRLCRTGRRMARYD